MTIEAADNPVLPASPIVIAKPIGSVRLAQAGDYLGERGFEGRVVGSDASATLMTSSHSGLGVGDGQFSSIPAGLPLRNARLTSAFGSRFHPISQRHQFHYGIDLAAPTGTPVAATVEGVVATAGWLGGYGLTVELKHKGNLETRYAHLSGITVFSGQKVTQGQTIGFVGSTGRSTGPHLHYEVRYANVAVDPLN